MVDPDRLSAAYETAHCDLLAESATAGHWIGHLSSSAPATATAISALALAERHAPIAAGRFADETRECRLSELIMASVRWLAKRQNPDGGWGDSDKSPSNLASTLLVRSAFALTCVPAIHPGLLERADAYIQSQGGVRAFARSYRKDKLLVAAVLTNCALAGLIHWRRVPALPFELACLPERTWKFLGLPAARYGLPQLAALGLARYFHRKPWNPISRLTRRLAADKSLQTIASQQPASGGYFESATLTSFVVMSLVSVGQGDHAVVLKGVEYLLNSVRPDGSWPISANLATRNTSLALNALSAAGEDVSDVGCLDWLLNCQRPVEDFDAPASGVTAAVVNSSSAPRGGWAWTDLPGGIADSDDTAGALLALANWSKADPEDRPAAIHAAAASGIDWLLDLQNNDGGWPTFCRGWGRLSFDSSAPDLTAQVLRALIAWRTRLVKQAEPRTREALDRRFVDAIERGLRYLKGKRHAEGYWTALWYGNPFRRDRENPIYGTARVLAAFHDLNRLDCPEVREALEWLMTMRHANGGWGGSLGADVKQAEALASVEETALAVEALLTCGQTKAHEAAALAGLAWLADAVEANRHQDTAPIGLYFARLWYHEKLYPLIMTVGVLGQAARRYVPRPQAPKTAEPAKT